jgi:phospholipid/cholesterol/gamma-HCH transport system permease protein
MPMTETASPRFVLAPMSTGTRLSVAGDWIIARLHEIETALGSAEITGPVTLDVAELGRIDTAGAFLLERALRTAGAFTIDGDHAAARALIAQVGALVETAPVPAAAALTGIIGLLDRTGRGAVDIWNETTATAAFFGEAMVTLSRFALRPWKLRWTSIVAVMEEAGLDAMPIVAFLSFFVGMVVAYIGATTLRAFDLDIYTVELVGYSMLREFGVVLTGIVLAGRTNSSFTAQIGTMRMRQEIDAMQTLGLKPMEVLTAPRLIAMTVMTPLLAFVATLAGIAGGILVGWLSLDINPSIFIDRLRSSVPLDQFWIGLSKAPVFGFVTALIACRQGLMTGGSVQSLGERVTTSVVQGIFAIIVLDAMFAIFYMELGI